jgi:hypothetical protein
MKLRLSLTVLTPLSALVFAACQSNTNDNFTNPPGLPPTTCAISSAVENCFGGSVGYTCTSDRPDDGDISLVCDDGTPGAAGMTIYCCAPYGQYWSDCNVDTSITGCVGTSFGFRCTGPEAPSDADSSLTCDTGVTSGSDTLYCCNSAVLPPTCAQNTTVQSECAGVAIGYACTGSDSPATSDPSLTCSPVADAGPGAYCCSPHE